MQLMTVYALNCGNPRVCRCYKSFIDCGNSDLTDIPLFGSQIANETRHINLQRNMIQNHLLW